MEALLRNVRCGLRTLRRNRRRVLLPALGLSFVLSAARLTVTAQSAPLNQAGASKPDGAKTAGETFKNLQVLGDLKGSPSPELWDTMQVFAGSLSVSCNYCHVAQAGSYDSDANKTKQIARNMIRMTRAINDRYLGYEAAGLKRRSEELAVR